MLSRHLPLFFSLVFLLALDDAAVAQQDDDVLWRDLLEQWAEQNDSETVPDDLIESLGDLKENPVNLNDTASDALLLLPFLSEYHRDAIKAYIMQYGAMVSTEELHFLNGFDSLTLSLMMPFVIVAPVEDNGLSLRQMLSKGHSNLRFGSKTVMPLSRGYVNDIYAGDPFRLYFRYRFSFSDRIVLQLSGDKDAGEDFSKGFDFYGYYLLLRDFGRLKDFVVGKYNLQFGQGVTLWSGSAPWMSASMPLRRYGQGVRPSSAFCEYGFMNGVAATVALLPYWNDKTLDMTLFYSDVNRDATSSADTADDGGILFSSLYQSGYHRTANEISKRHLLNERLVGGHLLFSGRNWRVGATAVSTTLASGIIPADHVYNRFAFSGGHNLNMGIDATLRYRRLLLFGELGIADNDSVRRYSDMTGWSPLAVVGGFQIHFDANTLLSVAARHVSPVYQNLHADIAGVGGSVQNSQGVTFFFQTRLPGYVRLQSYADFYRNPWMHYRVYSPSVGSDVKLTVSKDIARDATLGFQYRHRLSQRNSDRRLYAVEDCRRQQWQLSIDHEMNNVWRLLSRVVWSRFDCDDHGEQKGFVMMQQVEWHSSVAGRPFNIATRVALFDVSGYDARVYCFENDLMFEYSVPMFNGRGVRAFLLARCDICESLSAAFKYGITYCPENETMGSGYDLVLGRCRHELKLQMRLKF